jgi:hypothetical protein
MKHRTSQKGAQLGRQIASITPVTPAMCRTCAFRAGTFPNRCFEVVQAAARCVIGRELFYCHVKNRACAGFTSAIGRDNWGADLSL